MKRASDKALVSAAWCSFFFAVLSPFTRNPIPLHGTLKTIHGVQPGFAVLHRNHTRYGGEHVEFGSSEAEGCKFIGPRYVVLRDTILGAKELTVTCGSSWTKYAVAIEVDADGYRVLSRNEYYSLMDRENVLISFVTGACAAVCLACLVTLNVRAARRLRERRNA